MPSEERLNTADLDQDGLLTIIDVMQLLRRITKTDSQNPAPVMSTSPQNTDAAGSTTTTAASNIADADVPNDQSDAGAEDGNRLADRGAFPDKSSSLSENRVMTVSTTINAVSAAD